MSNQETRPRRSRRPWVAVTALTLAAATMMIACGPTTHPLQVTSIAGPAQHEMFEPLVSYCAMLRWTTCAAPEYTDDQEFVDIDGDYGPYAQVAPAPSLASATTDAQLEGANAPLVALVNVAAGKLSEAYTDLGLTNGFNCVYLHHDPTVSPAKYVAAVVASPSGSVCPTTKTADATFTLGVDAAAPNLPAGGAAPDLPPPVARFHEGQRGASPKRSTLIGMRCGAKWCMILPTTAQSDTLPLPHGSDHGSSQEWHVRGWHDLQHLAASSATGTPAVPSDNHAIIVPVANLASITDAMYLLDYQKAATVRFFNGPSGKYTSRWHFRHGENNEIWLRHVSGPNWTGQVRTWKFEIAGYRFFENRYSVNVTQATHNLAPGTHLPGTARWMWLVDDEGAWIECDDGCCKVSVA
jgi:hypothetical protein